jgi:hypothetical protein
LHLNKTKRKTFMMNGAMGGDPTSPERPKTPNEIVIRPSNERERTRAAALTLALFWGLALVSLIIPYANLVLTPLLFVLGPFAAWKASQRTQSAYNDVRPAEQPPSVLDRPGLRAEPPAANNRRSIG